MSHIEDNDPELNAPLSAYIKEHHNQDRCMGFIDGYKTRKNKELQHLKGGAIMSKQGDEIIIANSVNTFIDNSSKIDEKDSQILYTEEEVYELCYSAMKEIAYTPLGVFQAWFENNKK